MTCPGLPTLVSGAKTREADVELVKQVLEGLLSAGKRVLVAAHSYGGLVASEAFGERHTLASRQKRGLGGGIVRILYFACFILPSGSAIPDIMPFNADSKLDIAVDKDHDTCRVKNAQVAFYNDVAEQSRVDALVSQLVDHSLKVSWTPASAGIDGQGLAWLHVPCTYIYCELDNTITLPCQEKMVEDVRRLGGKIDREISLRCGHVPFLAALDLCIDVFEESSD